MRKRFGSSSRLSAVVLEAPEDIVLGPPKTAFASASGRNPIRSNIAGQDAEGAPNERGYHREKYTRDGQKHERDENQTRDTRTGQNHNRRSIKDDVEMWSSARQPRTGGTDERDKRNDENGYARDRGGGERPLRGFDKLRREGNQDANGEYAERRSMAPRTRDALSWGRDVEKHDGDGENSERMRPRGTRGGEKARHRDHDRGWDRAPQQDEDPLWMDEPEPKEERRNGPTQADFEEFRAKMKAGKKDKGQADAPTQEPASTHDRTTSGASQGTGKTKAEGRLNLGDLNDALFYDSLLGQAKKENKTPSSSAEESQQTILNAAAKIAKPSKFSSFFNVDSGPKQQATLNPPPENASSEDKAGFQRILNLLGQQQQQQQQQQQPLSSGEKTPPRSSLASMFADMQQSPPLQSPPSRQQDDTRSPPPNVRKTKDSEYLLNLMRQPQKSGPGDPRMAAGSRLDLDDGPGISHFAQFAMSPPQETTHQPLPSSAPPPGFFDDHPMQEMPPRDKLNPNAGNSRPGPPGLFDLFNNRQRPPPSGLPPGLAQRPAGFDQLPPGFGQPQPQPRQGMPPPGFVPPPTQQQQQQHRGPSAMAPGMFPSRPNGQGMPPPPPGFMNMGSGPPPPGFQTMGLGPDGPPFGVAGGGRGGGFDFGQGFSPPGQQRR